MEYNTTSTETWNSVNNSYPRKPPERDIDNIELSFCIILCVVCTFGLAGNGTVIWLLGFRIKRTSFTTYVWNLAVADFGLLILVSLMILDIFAPNLLVLIVLELYEIFILFYSVSQLLLTAISVDRCVSVLFPIWYQCQRPPRLSTFVCVLIWVLSFAFNGIPIILHMSGYWGFDPTRYQLIANVILCVPLITISTLILFIRVCFKSQQHKRGKILVVVLLTLLFYLFFAFPLNAVFLLIDFILEFHGFRYTLYCLYLGTTLNSSANPFIYFLVGRTKNQRSHSRESVKVILQRVFKEEEIAEAEEPPPLETQL